MKNQPLDDRSQAAPEHSGRHTPERRSARSASFHVSLLTYDSDIRIDVRSVAPKPGVAGGRPFTAVAIDNVSWQPDRAQLVELRDKITAYLEKY